MNWSYRIHGDRFAYQTAANGGVVLLHRLEDGATRFLQDERAGQLADELDEVTTSAELDLLIHEFFVDVPLHDPAYCAG